MSVYRERGLWWFRFGRNGMGLKWEDHRIHAPLFSDREGLRPRIHIGPFCFELLRSEKQMLRVRP